MVAVLMSTYNGERYLKEQLDSILSQSMPDFTLYIRDDGSTDGTAALIRSYEDSRIRFYQGENLGPAESFFSLLRMAREADYVFFSDQDDIWQPDKLEKMLKEIERYEPTPVMVFSDFSMIDGDGAVTARSFSEHASLRVAPGEIPVSRILAHPYVFGCASVINRSLASLVLYPPKGIEMHDCWIALTAASVGKLIYMPDQTIAHRFHSSNATGRSGQDSFLTRLRRATKGFQAQAENSALRLRQAGLLLETYGNQVLPEPRQVLTAVSEAAFKGKLAAVKALRSAGIGRQKRWNTLFFYLTVLGIKGEIQ